ncbi:MAG: type II toxin-antitoxin system VapC family toxin, partial [Dermatophilaceae bacterium]
GGRGSVSYLLDTHAFVWAVADIDRLPPPVMDVLESDTDVHVSAVTAWELATKIRLGKLPGGEQLVADHDGHCRRLLARRLPITDEHALLAGRLDWQHRDPFDRALAAQCLTEGLTLVTRDRAFADIAGLTTVW